MSYQGGILVTTRDVHYNGKIVPKGSRFRFECIVGNFAILNRVYNKIQIPGFYPNEYEITGDDA